MLDHGDDKPIWMTELGWSVTGERCPHGNGQGTAGVSPAKQAAFLTRAYACRTRPLRGEGVLVLTGRLRRERSHRAALRPLRLARQRAPGAGRVQAGRPGAPQPVMRQAGRPRRRDDHHRLAGRQQEGHQHAALQGIGPRCQRLAHPESPGRRQAGAGDVQAHAQGPVDRLAPSARSVLTGSRSKPSTGRATSPRRASRSTACPSALANESARASPGRSTEAAGGASWPERCTPIQRVPARHSAGRSRSGSSAGRAAGGVRTARLRSGQCPARSRRRGRSVPAAIAR